MSIVNSLNRAAGLPWASSFHSDFLPFDPPFEFRNLRDECMMLRRKLSDGPTDAHLSRGKELVQFVSHVEAYNSLDLHAATAILIGRWAPSGQAEEALRAFAGLDSFRPRHVGVAAKIADLTRHHVVRLQSSLRRETADRTWLPQLEESLARLGEGAEDVAAGRQSVLAIAELFGSGALLERFAHFRPVPGVPLPETDLGTDVEAALRLLAEPLGFVRVSDAVDRLIAAEVAVSLPDLRALLDEAEDATPLADGWWCFTGQALGPSAAVLRTTLKIAAVSGRPFHSSDLRAALLNAAGEGIGHTGNVEAVPSLDALVEWARLGPELDVDQGMISMKFGEIDPLSETEWAIVEVIAAQTGGVCTTDRLLDQCLDIGLPKESVKGYLKTGVIVDEVATGVWGLRGAERDDQAIDRLRR